MDLSEVKKSLAEIIFCGCPFGATAHYIFGCTSDYASDDKGTHFQRLLYNCMCQPERACAISITQVPEAEAGCKVAMVSPKSSS